ncbi:MULTISPECIES: sensor histidine kinase KdpD [Bacillaceae]|uniref:sensor histidine kinase n=1 Tax=Bacillaceae TaxID=186817 RepID=UPI0015E2F2CA|nr:MULTISPECIES: HAMP domain-containing sensor histidine kinase [Bacillaceae]
MTKNWLTVKRFTILSNILMFLIFTGIVLLQNINRVNDYAKHRINEVLPNFYLVETHLAEYGLQEDFLNDKFGKLPGAYEYMMILDNDSSYQNIAYNQTSKNINIYEGKDKKYLPIIKWLLGQSREDIYVKDGLSDKKIKVEFYEVNGSVIAEIEHAIHTEAFNGQLYTKINLSVLLIEDFKEILITNGYLYLIIFIFFFLFQALLFETIFKPLSKMTNHYKLKNKFNITPHFMNDYMLREMEELNNVTNSSVEKMLAVTDETHAFLEEIVHEVRNPAHNIKNTIEYLEDLIETDTLPEIKEGLFHIKNESSNIDSLLKGIKLSHELYYLGGNPPDSWIEPKSCIEPLMAAYMRNYPSYTFIFNDNVSKTTKIWIDEYSFELVMQNLLSNAVKYSTKESTIFVGIRENKLDNTINIDVTNTGSSIHYSNINKIFDKYVRLSMAKQITSGSGIGLWIVKRVSEIYDVNIDVNSTNQSATFSLKFKHIKQENIEE